MKFNKKSLMRKLNFKLKMHFKPLHRPFIHTKSHKTDKIQNCRVSLTMKFQKSKTQSLSCELKRHIKIYLRSAQVESEKTKLLSCSLQIIYFCKIITLHYNLLYVLLQYNTYLKKEKTQLLSYRLQSYIDIHTNG